MTQKRDKSKIIQWFGPFNIVRELWVGEPLTQEAREIFEKLDKAKYLDTGRNYKRCVFMIKMDIKNDTDAMAWHALVEHHMPQWGSMIFA